MKKYLLLLLAVTIVAAGCDREIERDPVRSVPSPLPVPTAIQVMVNQLTLELDWTVSDSAGISRYRIYVADTLPQDFRVHDSTTNTSAQLTGLGQNRLYYFYIASVAPGGLESDRSQIFSATIGYTSLVINNGAQFTQTRDVIIQVNSSAPASQVILSEDSTFADANYIPWAPERSFTLTPGDAAKLIYGRLIFTDGSQSGQLLEDGITLDSQADIDSVFYQPRGTVFQVGDTITFGLTTGELFGRAQVSFTGVSRVDLFDNGTMGDNLSNDGIYHGIWVVPVNTNLFQDMVIGDFTDAAGNTALTVTSNDLLNANTPPLAVDLNLIPPTDSARFQWNQSFEPDFDSYRIYSSTTPTVDTNSTLLAIISNPLPPTPWYGVVAPATLTYYRVFVFDQHGAATGSNTVF